MMEEIWKRTNIVSNRSIGPANYEVSNLGNVRCVCNGKIAPKWLNKREKLTERCLSRTSFSVFIDSKETHFNVDSLVAATFLNIPYGDPIYHIDGDYSNNAADNLSDHSQYIVQPELKFSEEIWLPIIGYEGLYDVSNCGRVRSRERYSKGRIYPSIILKTIHAGGEYNYVALYNANGTTKQLAVHRLVAQHFLPTPDNFEQLEVNHKDFNVNNNHADNLEWVTRLENIRYSSSRGRMDSRKHPEAKIRTLLRAYPVYCIDTDTLYLRWTDAENDLRLWNGAIKNCLTKGVKSHGYSFREVDKHSEEYKKAFIDEFHRCYPEHELNEYRKHFEAADMLYLLE